MELIKVLSESQIEQIHDKTEDILETVGLQVTHPQLLRLCHAAGARVDEIGSRVRFPRPLLRELLAGVPSSYTVSTIGGKQYVYGGDQQYSLAIVTDPWIVDYETQKPRRPCLEDIRRHTIIAQKLDTVVAISLMDFPVTDVEGPTSSLRALEEHMLHHNKHINIMATDMERYEDLLQVVRILGQTEDLSTGRLASVGVGVLSALAVSDLNVELLLSACANNLPVIPTVCPIAGMTSPYSLASTLLQSNVETIGLAALTQVVRRGHPYLFGFGPSVGHMRYMHDMYYTLDKVLWKIGAVQLGKFYNMPTAAECGGSMTYRYDQQNGAEGILFMLAAANSGANLLSGIGSTYTGIAMSAEMMIIHTAWLEAARFLQRGIQIDELRLGLENIKRAGPGGNFITDDLTLRFVRGGEFFASELFDYEANTEDTSRSLLRRAHERVEQMVAGFESPHPGQVQENLRRYLADRYRQMGA